MVTYLVFCSLILNLFYFGSLFWYPFIAINFARVYLMIVILKNKFNRNLVGFFYRAQFLLLASTWSLLSATFPMLIANYDASSNILPFGLAHFSLDAQVLRNANMWHAEFCTESRYRRLYPLATEKFTWAMFKQSLAFRQALPRICCNPSMKWKNGEKLLKGEL